MLPNAPAAAPTYPAAPRRTALGAPRVQLRAPFSINVPAPSRWPFAKAFPTELRTTGFGVVSLDDCTQMCRRCARCRWISLSLAHQQCDWYHSCNTTKLNRRFGGETFRTRGPLRST